jgi:hypothetical protein
MRRKGGRCQGIRGGEGAGASEEMVLRSQWVASNAGSLQTAAFPRWRGGLR